MKRYPRLIEAGMPALRKMPHTEPELTYFDHIHGKGSLSQLLSLLSDSRYTYDAIGRRFGVSKQRIGQLALIMGINGGQRKRQRTLCRLAFSHRDGYSADVLAVIRAIKRSGLEVLPYRRPLSKRALGRTSKQLILINRLLCRIYCRRHDHGTTGDGRYIQFRVGKGMGEAKVVILALFKPNGMKIYVVPVRHLLKAAVILLPFNGKYAMGRYKKPNRDWIAYENAWQWVKS